MTRSPYVAGQFYEADPERLRQQIRGSFLHPLGPGELPLSGEKSERDIVACVTPHAGFMYSGACAAHVYGALSMQVKPKTIIILGTNHTGIGGVTTSFEDWATPLGIVMVDREAIRQLGIEVDERAHRYEHSIEVQLPFLQYIWEDFEFVPIIVSPRLGVDGNLEDRISELDNVLVIASSDFTHFGLNYGYMPFTDNVRERLRELDMGAITFIEQMDEEGFADYVRSTGATICGHAPISSAIKTAKLLGAKKGELLKYTTSGDIVGDFSSAVAYAAIVFRK
jgi:AmmeMemoRadiSam system protein B